MIYTSLMEFNFPTDLPMIDGPMDCPMCANKDQTKSMEKDSFQYGEDASVMIEVEIPVYTCNECNLQYTTYEACDLRHNAVCKYLGVLNPREITEIREANKADVETFANTLRIDKVLLEKYERGALIQGVVLDNCLRLLRYVHNYGRLGCNVSVVH